MNESKLLIVIPAFNEQNNIVKLINDIEVSVPKADIIVINDCSTDSTSATVRGLGKAKVVDLPCNLGIGGAVQTGFKYAAVNGYRYMVQVDGDGQHIPQEIDRLMAVMDATDCDMVIGSRFLDVQSYRTTTARRMGIKFFYYLFKLLVNIEITDGTSGFRLYNRKSITLLSRYYADDYPEPDAIILLQKNGMSIKEVGVRMKAREHGASSITPLKSPYYMAKVIISILFSYSRTRW